MKINKRIFSIISIGMLMPMFQNEAYADLKNPAIIAVAEGEYEHSSKGQQSSDCILIQHNGMNIVIDSGAKKDKFIKFLQNNGVSKIDYLIVTHMHGDHIGGLKNTIDTSYILNNNSSTKASINNIKISKVIIQKPASVEYLQAKDRDNGKDKFVTTYNNLVKSLKNKNITVSSPSTDVKKPTTIKLDDETKIVIKNANYFNTYKSSYTPVKAGIVPTSAQDKNLMELNSQSLVLEFTHVNDTILLTGDATNHATDELIKNKQIGEYDVIKVPHHGYGGSSNFNLLDTTNPDFAVLPSSRITNSNIMAKYKYNKIPVYGTQNNKNIVLKSTGNKITPYTQNTNSKGLTAITKSNDSTYGLDNAYLRKNGKNYYYLKDSSNTNKLVKVDFSTAKGFDSSYPKSGVGYICVKNNEFQYGWQKINDNYYYFNEKGLAVTNKVVELAREEDSKGNLIKSTSSSSKNYYLLGSKGECLTGFQKATINGKTKTYYFVKGANNIKNKGKLYSSSNGKFLEIGDNKYWIEKDGSLSTKTGFIEVTENNSTNKYYLKNGIVQTGFIKIDNKEYYFVKGANNPENKGKLYSSSNGKFLEIGDNKYWIEKDGSLSKKTGMYSLNDNGKTQTFYLKNGVVQVGFQTVNGVEYYFKKGHVTPANKGHLDTSSNGKFLYTKNDTVVYFINPDGTKYTKSTLNFEGKTYKFNSNGVCTTLSK